MTTFVGKFKWTQSQRIICPFLSKGYEEMTEVFCGFYLFIECTTSFFYLMSRVNRLSSNEVMSYEECKT